MQKNNVKTDIRGLLKNRDYCLFWFSSAFAMASSNIIQFILAIYILDTTGSAKVFAGTLSVIVLPRLFLTPLAGVIGDRFRRIRLMQLFTLLIVLLLYLFFKRSVHGFKIRDIFFLVIALELIEVFYQAPESAIIPELVPDRLLNEAISFSRVDDGFVMVTSPAIGALIYRAFGLSGGLFGAFLLELLSLLLLLPIRPLYVSEKAPAPSMAESFKDGLSFLLHDTFIRRMTFLAPAENFFLSALFSVSITHLLLHVYSVSEGVFGLYRAVTASMVLLVPPLVLPLVKKIPVEDILPRSARLIAAALLGIGLTVLFSSLIAGRRLFPVLALIALFDCLSIVAMIPASMALMVKLQESIPDSHRSRVLSLFRMCATISIPLGELFYGFLSDTLPPFMPPFIASAGVFLCALGFRKAFRTAP